MRKRTSGRPRTREGALSACQPTESRSPEPQADIGHITKSGAFDASEKLALVDGSIAEAATAAKIAEVAKSKFGSIDALVNNAGLYFSKHFTDYTVDDLRSELPRSMLN